MRGEDGRGTCPVLSSIAPRQRRSSPPSQGLPSHSRVFSRTLLTPARASRPLPRGNACNRVTGAGEARRRKRGCQPLTPLDKAPTVMNTSTCYSPAGYQVRLPVPKMTLGSFTPSGESRLYIHRMQVSTKGWVNIGTGISQPQADPGSIHSTTQAPLVCRQQVTIAIKSTGRRKSDVIWAPSERKRNTTLTKGGGAQANTYACF